MYNLLFYVESGLVFFEVGFVEYCFLIILKDCWIDKWNACTYLFLVWNGTQVSLSA